MAAVIAPDCQNISRVVYSAAIDRRTFLLKVRYIVIRCNSDVPLTLQATPKTRQFADSKSVTKYTWEQLFLVRCRSKSTTLHRCLTHIAQLGQFRRLLLLQSHCLHLFCSTAAASIHYMMALQCRPYAAQICYAKYRRLCWT